MPIDPKNPYSPPGVYTETLFETQVSSTLSSVNVPMLIGPGNETLTNNIEVVRGSSATADQRIVLEDAAGRAVMEDGSLGDFDASARFVKVRNYPIVTGEGSGTTSDNPSDVVALINNEPIVVLSVDGDNGVVELATSPKDTDEVRVSYFFNRTDTALQDDLSSQVSSGTAELIGSAGDSFTIGTATDSFLVSVDGGEEVEIVVAAAVEPYTTEQIALAINAANSGLTASTTTNNEGAEVLVLEAAQSIVIGLGTMNSVIGFSAGQSTSRNATFFTKQTPVVTGDNSGTTTTNASDVTVTVDGSAVEVASVDGSTGAITLAVPPAEGAVVSASYFWNSFQDTFDYLANIGVTDILSCGIARGVRSYIDGTDFVLKDDKIFWGTSFNLYSGVSTSGSAEFGSSQVYGQLIDDKCYFKECAPVTDTSVSPAVTSKVQFRLPYVPTTGNGLGNEITAEQFRTVANSRRDYATNRPELVKAYWGFDVQDAMDRGEVTVVRVDGANALVTLAEEVPAGAKVYATFYHSRMTDTGNGSFTVTCASAGSSGTGTFTVSNPAGVLVPIVSYDSKGAGMLDEVMFPSGNETQPRAYHWGGTPVEEDVTITFEDRDATPAEWTLSGIGPFFFIDGESDTLGVTAGDFSGNIDLGASFMATLVSDVVSYDKDTDDASWTLAGDETVTLLVDGQSVEATVAAGAGVTLDNFVDALNTAAQTVPVEYVGKGQFGGLTVAVGQHDDAELLYTHAGGTLAVPVTLNNGEVCATPAAVAAHVQTQIQAAITVAAGGAANEPQVTVSTNSKGQMVVGFQKASAHADGKLEFIGDANDAGSFWVLAGFDCASAGNGVALADGPIAARSSVAGDSGALLNDRLILRNRILPAGAAGHPESVNAQCYVRVASGTNLSRLGLAVGDDAKGAASACVIPASIAGAVDWSKGQDAGTSQPVATFYDGTEAGNAQNNVLIFNFDGNPVTVEFTASGAGTDTALGPIGEAGSILRQLAEAVATQVDGYAAWTNVRDAGVISQEGNALRISSDTGASGSSVVISEDGSANQVLGLEGSASRIGVDTDLLVGAFNSSGADVDNMMGLGAAAGEVDFQGGFADDGAASGDIGGLAKVFTADSGAKSVFLTTRALGTGAGLSVTGGNALLSGSRLMNSASDGVVGEAGKSGFVVTSSNPAGSGSANDSTLSTGGVGSDGIVGQTYMDSVTGLTFTILPRDGGGNYVSGATATYVMSVRNEGVCDANNPITAIPGLWTWVSNTAGVEAGDTVEIETFKASSQEKEPANGQSYYVSYVFEKRDFTPRIFTRLATIEQAFGSIGPDSPTSLASYLMMLNGGGAIGVKQVKRASGSTNATEESYMEAIDELEGLLPGGIRPSVLLPLVPASLRLANYLSQHCTIQSDITHRAERTAILGFQAGTQPTEAAALVQDLNGGQGDMRIRFVYPDMMTVTTTDALGNDTESLIDGRYLAVMMGARQLSSNRDVATPWTGTRLVGTNGLARQLDAVSQNQVASAGVSVMEMRGGQICVRHGLTSDMSDVLTKTPTVTQIIDEVQQNARAVLASYIGVKFLPSILSQVEGRVAKMFGSMIDAQIVANYTGIKASINPDDPTMANLEAYYQPIFPLLYIVLSFNLRSQL